MEINKSIALSPLKNLILLLSITTNNGKMAHNSFHFQSVASNLQDAWAPSAACLFSLARAASLEVAS